MKKGEQLKVTDGVEFTCPFCKANVIASIENECVIHGLPMCKEFESSEPDEYIIKVNRALGIKLS